MKLPIFRQLKPRLVGHLIDWRPGMRFDQKLAELAPFWIRAAHAENGHQPYKPMYDVAISDSDFEIFHDTYWKSLEIHANLMISRILIALENSMPMDGVLSDLRANRPIRVVPKFREVVSP